MAEYSRPREGFRFDWGGVKLNSSPDACPLNKYPSAINIRSTNGTLRTRPGYTTLFSAANNNAITDIKAYAAIKTDAKPRFLVRNVLNKIYLDNGNLQTTLSGNNNGYGVSMIPFRPPASSQSWMYVAGLNDYQKISAPDANNNTTAQKVGIAEPQSQLEAATNAPSFTSFFATAGNWTQGGTAAAPSNSNLFTDTVGAAVIADPVVATRLSVQVAIPYYTPGMLPTFAGANTYPVEEVWPACANATVSAIRYDSGTSGNCSIVPSVDLSDTLGRGSLIRLNASETVLVLSVTKGTNHTCMIRCSTAGTIAAGQAIAGILAIVVHGSVVAADAITMPVVNSSITAGTATLSKAVTANTFSPYLSDDYIHVTLLLQNIAAVTSVSFIFNVGNSVDYSTSILTYTIDGAALALHLIAGQVVEVHFPISALSSAPGALNPCNGFRVQVVTTASQTISVGGMWVGGGGEADTGEVGAPFYLRAIPRSTLTGAQGNATPPMRYGLLPRRQSATVSVPSASYDGQITIWDYYAKGGSVTSYGYVGSVLAGASSFTFNYSDAVIAASIAGGRTLPTQNFEPWPSIDESWSAASGGGTTITAVGSLIAVSGPSTWPDTIARWLPGTLVTLAGFQTYTLRARPFILSATSYLFEIEECVGSQSPSSISVAEPVVARQVLAYVWGPDAYGVVFANGDPLRPGTQYFCRAYALDIAPQTNTLEISTPDVPLIGGVCKGGLSIACSTDKWFALYPSGGGYTQVEWPVGKASVSPFGMATDGVFVYFWARDGICRTTGAGFESLTDEDLYPLFPHDGVQGQDQVILDDTYYAPDYGAAAAFRLETAGVFLYADYVNSSGNRCTLVCDLRGSQGNGQSKFAWSQDIYGDSITRHYQPEQPPGALTGTANDNPLLVLTDTAGNAWKMEDYTDDFNTAISGSLVPFQYDGGDARAPMLWGDLYLDCIPSAKGVTANNNGVSVSAVTGSTVLTASRIAPAASRQYVPISLPNGNYEGKFMGLQIKWKDKYSAVPANNQAGPTEFFMWQPSFTPKPETIRRRNSDWFGSLT